VKIVAIDRQGKEHTLEGRDGWSVMEILRDGGLDIAAECGGACACATCHIYVNEGWYEKLAAPSESEIDMLDMALADRFELRALRARASGRSIPPLDTP
jgi:2Fe-2S ferredoxin